MRKGQFFIISIIIILINLAIIIPFLEIPPIL